MTDFLNDWGLVLAILVAYFLAAEGLKHLFFRQERRSASR